MDTDTLQRLIDNPSEPVPVEWMRQCLSHTPWYILPALMLLHRNPQDVSDDERQLLMQHIALNAPDRAAALALIDADEAALADFYPPAPAPEPVSTDQAIDTFLAKYCPTSPAETSTLEQLIFNPQPEYATVLESQERSPQSEERSVKSEEGSPITQPEEAASSPVVGTHHGASAANDNADNADKVDKVDKDIKADMSDVSDMSDMSDNAVKAVKGATTADTPSFTESLARIYVRQGRYEKAYELFEQLNLDNPEKSPYFADQLRFLRLLIINSQHHS